MFFSLLLSTTRTLQQAPRIRGCFAFAFEAQFMGRIGFGSILRVEQGQFQSTLILPGWMNTGKSITSVTATAWKQPSERSRPTNPRGSGGRERVWMERIDPPIPLLPTLWQLAVPCGQAGASLAC